MRKSFGNWLTGSISLDEEWDTFQKKLNVLTIQETDNLAVVAHEEIQPGKKRRREFEFWLANVKAKKSEYSRIENELKEQGPSKILKIRIEREIKETEELIQQGKFPNGVVLNDHASKRLPMVTTELVGRSCAENVETIFKLLKEDGVFGIGVHGMGGVGKTTIAKEVYNRLLPLDSGFGGNVYWVTASRDCSLEKLQDDIGKEVGLENFSKEHHERKKSLLSKRFSEMDASVLIIDDLWDSYVGDKIGIPLKSRGCKIVITTRKLEVCRRMLCDQIFKIVPLNQADSWTLFIKHLGDLQSDVKDIAVKVVEECSGLPLALVTMGCSMRGITDVFEWETVLYELRKPASRQDDMEDEVFQILKFSFDNLKDHKVQNCFLSCLLFPEDYEICKEFLVELWIEEGLLDEVENQQNRVDKAHVILNRLLNACLLESSDKSRHSVKMHDLIRDMGIIITKEHPRFIAEAGKQLKEVPEEDKWSKDLAKVSLSCNKIKEIPSGMAPVTPNLTVLMLDSNKRMRKIPDSFFVHMKALTLLDLSATGIERVPESVSDLENLRGLALVCCQGLMYVPSVAKLTKLRTLHLEGCNNLREAPRGLERLKSVEKLSYMPWDVSDILGFNKVIQSLKSLSYYHFLICDPTLIKYPRAPNAGRAYFNYYEKAVWIRGGEFGEDKSNFLLPTTLEYLKMDKCDLKGRSLEVVFPSLSEVTAMTEIDFSFCKGLEIISGSSGTQYGSSFLFTKLEKLKLDGLPDLRSIAKTVAPHSFAHLRELDIEDCPKIKVVLPVTNTMEFGLPKLQRIKTEECQEMEIFESNKATLSIARIILPELRYLKLISLPKIKVIFPFTDELHLPNLQSIEVVNCEEVEEIFESNKAHSKPILSLPKLNNLRIWGLPKLGSLYRGRLRCTSLVLHKIFINRCPKLKWWRLPGGDLISDEPCSSSSSSSSSRMLDSPPETPLPDPDYDYKTQWGASLSLSLPFDNHQS